MKIAGAKHSKLLFFLLLNISIFDFLVTVVVCFKALQSSCRAKATVLVSSSKYSYDTLRFIPRSNFHVVRFQHVVCPAP